LSLRVFVIKHTEFEDLSTPPRTLPVMSAQPDGKQKQNVKVGTGDMLSISASSDVSRDRGTIPVR
jgi:hypothetical protein